MAEASGLDWLRDDDPAGERRDTLLFGDLLLRTGLDARTEAQLSWTPVARLRTRAVADGPVDVVTGSGDVRLGLRRSLRRPDGEGVSIAVEGFVTVPTGARDIGRGDWSAGAIVPASLSVGDWSLAFTGEVDADADEVRTGHHPAAAATFGIGHDLAAGLSATVELAVRRDQDPDTAHTEWMTAASFAWQVHETAQVDLLFAAGLNRAAPDVRIAVGGARLF